MFHDWTLLFLLPAMILAFYAQYKVSSTFAKYSKIMSGSGLSGQQFAKNLLDRNSLGNVLVKQTQGHLSDNYDPRDKTLNLSTSVYGGSSVAALGVVAHEVGHAVQDSKAYFPLKLRSALVPVSSLGSQLSIPLFFVGLIFAIGPLMDAGIIFFSLAVAFTVITLPVEFNASKRAYAMMTESGYLSMEEAGQAKKVLNAAALTYVAATAMSVAQLLRLLILRDSRR
ncbi:MAG: zinc metallopeptidase [Candidatus Margulisiibacteriota bacterium]